MSTRHTLIAEIEVPTGTGPDDIDYVPAKLEIEFSYLSGRAASWDDPGWSAEVGLIGAKMLTIDGLAVTLRSPEDERADQERADDYLQGEGYTHACEEAVSDIRQRRAEARDYEGRI
jgi:hypothetical protein